MVAAQIASIEFTVFAAWSRAIRIIESDLGSASQSHLPDAIRSLNMNASTTCRVGGNCHTALSPLV